MDSVSYTHLEVPASGSVRTPWPRERPAISVQAGEDVYKRQSIAFLLPGMGMMAQTQVTTAKGILEGKDLSGDVYKRQDLPITRFFIRLYILTFHSSFTSPINKS